MGIEVVGDRVVWQGNHVSGAGVSAGIDMALSLTERVHGRELAESLQLVIEYDPQPRSTPARPPRPTPAGCASRSACCWATVRFARLRA
jgi:transcriptional regulator GlxA family with amidase domain